jgi:DNA repair protein RecO (recombination protein O)
MQLQDKGIIVSTLKHSESSFVVKIFSENNGIHSGYVKHGFSKQNIGLCQIGNFVDFVWSSKSPNNLGYLKLDLIKSYAIFIFENQINLHIFECAINLINTFIPEQQEEKNIYEHFLKILKLIEEETDKFILLKEMIFFEKNILEILGIGLDLCKCAGGGDCNDLAYISPKTGRAVSKKAGEAYKDKLFILPKFLCDPNASATTEDIQFALKILSHFLYKNLQEHHTEKQYKKIQDSQMKLFQIIK